MSDFGGMDTVFPHPTAYGSEVPAQTSSDMNVIDPAPLGELPVAIDPDASVVTGSGVKLVIINGDRG